MSAVDTRPIPVSLLRWPRVRDLITQHKCILMYLWSHPDQTAAGCYLLPLDATAADLSMTAPSMRDAVDEFARRGLVEMDEETGEILLPDWYRWYTPRSPAARGACEAALGKIRSDKLRKKAENSYKSMTAARKEKEKEKEKKTTTTPTPPAAGGGGGGGVATDDLADLRLMLLAQAHRAGKTDPAGWVAGALRRLQGAGLDDDTAAQLADWRAARQRVAPDTDTVPWTRGTSAGLRRALAVSGQQEYLPQASRSTV